MTIPRENLIWGPVANFRTLLATCPAFRTLVGATTIDGAMAHVYTPILGATEIAGARPFAVIDQGTVRDMTRISTSGFSDAGSILFILEADVADANTAATAAAREAAHTAFLTVLGEILAEIKARAASADHLRVRGIRMIAAPARSDDDGEGDFYQVAFEIDWGD